MMVYIDVKKEVAFCHYWRNS